MTVFLNGQFLPEDQAVVSIFDRGFLYGDGLFETLRIRNHQLFRWQQYADRLWKGADFLQIPIPLTPKSLQQTALELAQRNGMSDCLLRINLSRGTGTRGYSTRNAKNPVLALTTHPAPPPESTPTWTLATSSITLPTHQPLTTHKTTNKLPHILARREAEAAGADEAILLNSEGAVAEATSGNLFWIDSNNQLCTPPLNQGALAGITRDIVLELAANLKIPTRQTPIRPADLSRATGVFLSLSSYGIVEITALDQHPLKTSPHTQTLQSAYQTLLHQETS